MRKLSVRLNRTEDIGYLSDLMHKEGRAEDALCIDRIYVDAAGAYRYFSSKAQGGDVWEMPGFKGKAAPEIFFVLPDVMTPKALDFLENYLGTLCRNSDGFMVHSLDEIFFLKEHGYPLDKVIASERLYAYNNEAVQFLRELGISHFTHPLELTLKESAAVDYGDLETMIYGRVPLMVSAGCVHKNTAGCDQKQQNLILKDRKKMDFYVQNLCDYCYNVIYNSVPVMLIDEMDRLHPDCARVRIDLTTESRDETERILGLYRECCKGDIPGKDSFGFSYTRGHYHKGLT